MIKQTMKEHDLFEIDKVQIFDRLTDSTGDTRQISEYTPQIEKQEINKNQLQLF